VTRKVQCLALGEELDGLAFQPYPGELGKRIFENISQQAWQKWMAHQTMLINENRLSPINPEHRKYLETEMEKYLFGEGSEIPEGYVPE
jgi:Fe-S cluster biosynthesis and repair protein YggX